MTGDRLGPLDPEGDAGGVGEAWVEQGVRPGLVRPGGVGQLRMTDRARAMVRDGDHWRRVQAAFHHPAMTDPPDQWAVEGHRTGVGHRVLVGADGTWLTVRTSDGAIVYVSAPVEGPEGR